MVYTLDKRSPLRMRVNNACKAVCQSRILRDETGQDLIEYALMAATIAVATAAIFPQSIAPNICAIFSKVNSSLGSANL